MEWPWKKTWLLLVETIVLVQAFGSSSGCFSEEKASLLDFKAAYSDETLLRSWVDQPKSNCCDWERVTCDFSSGHVIHLSLEDTAKHDMYGQYSGCAPLNWSLFLSFKELRSLNLSYNCFDDFIWKGDYRSKQTLKRLETFDLSYNLFNESIMEVLSGLISLKNLYLSHNKISGLFPSKEILLLQNLELLDLHFNNLNSPVRTQVNRSKPILKRLETLDLGRNFFNESIMGLLIGFTSLKNLILSNNHISGLLPSKELSLLGNLELVDLSYNNLKGSLKGLCKMKQVEELHLIYNNFGGALDLCLSNLTSLRVLDLKDNSLSGRIPEPLIASLTSLEYLSLDRNKFEGLFSLSILANISQLKGLQLGYMDSKTFQVETENPSWNASFQLEHLQIPSCKVNLPTKSIPTFLSSQNSLKYVDLSGNNLVGMFPNWLILNNSKLEEVYLNYNFLTGPFKLPFDLKHHMDQLQRLDISNNEIQGKLPENIGFIFPHLGGFLLFNNKFEGHIPASIGEMSGLVTLDLANNNFSGKVPKHIFDKCIHLMDLSMDNNQLNGTLPSFLGNSWLYSLTASRNNFEGPITKDICQLYLDIMDLSHNRLSGALPSCFDLPIVKVINLQGNSFTGTIPAFFSNSSSVAFINLSDNNFTGTIPENIYGLESSLRFLLLAGNRLHGQLSTQICQLRYLQIIDLSRNNFTGSIPSCFNKILFQSKDLTFMISYSNEEAQVIIKGLPRSYKSYMLSIMSELDLSSNQFTGEIPQELGYLVRLHALNLSHNHLNGSIPGSFHKLQSIESLDLSNNNLSGQIPPQLQDLNYLAVFNVSYNNLSGRAPDKGQFGTFDESSYRGNPYLTYNNSNRGIAIPLPPPTPLDEGKKDDSAIDFTSFYWSFAASYVMVVIVLVIILWINPYWRRAWFYYVQRCLLKCLGQFLEDEFY